MVHRISLRAQPSRHTTNTVKRGRCVLHIEKPHEVEITKDFYLGTTEVTQKQFRDVMGYNPSYFSKDGKAGLVVAAIGGGEPARPDRSTKLVHYSRRAGPLVPGQGHECLQECFC